MEYHLLENIKRDDGYDEDVPEHAMNIISQKNYNIDDRSDEDVYDVFIDMG